MNIFDFIVRPIISILIGLIEGVIIIGIIQMIINTPTGQKKENSRKYSYINGPFCIVIILIYIISCFLNFTRGIYWETDTTGSTFVGFDLLIRLTSSILFGFIVSVVIIAIIETTINSPKRLKKGNSIYLFGRYWITIISILAILYFLNSTRRVYWGNDTIGSFFEKNEYTAQYYVNLFTEENSYNRIKADIRSTIIYGKPYYDEEGFGRVTSIRVYLIEKAYLGNDEYITFLESNTSSKGVYNTLKIGEKIKIKDDKGEDWFIELTKEKVD